MKWRHLVIPLLFVPLVVFGQPVGNVDHTTLSTGSPFEHLVGSLQKTASVRHSVCPLFLYYQNGPNPSYAFFQENLPASSEWAMKITWPSGATICTVWTQMMDFELLNTTLFDRDTIRFYVRNANAPYAILYSTWFIARQGQNQGVVEVDQPVVPPFVTPVISNPPRDLLLGYKVFGKSNHVVKWRFTTPSLYGSPPRSYKVTPSGLIPASNIVGQSVDWINEVRLCCDLAIPVELSIFNAQVETDAVSLRWRTETETNNFHFQLQRALSPDGPWETRAFVTGHGTTTQPRDYSFRDPYSLMDFAGRPPVLWYRLRQQDFDGMISEHPAIQVHLTDLAALGFELSPVYPNPVIASSSQLGRIRYRVPVESQVRISVYDMLGREITVLANNVHPAGMYESSWTPLTEQGLLNSGTYIVRLVSGSVVLTQSIAVVR